MDSVTYFVFLLAIKMVISIGDVIKYDDGSVQMSYQKAVLKKGTDSLLIQDPASASLYKDSNNLSMDHGKAYFEKCIAEGLTKIGDGSASHLMKKSDGTVRTRIEGSEFNKYGEGDVDLYHGNSIQLYKTDEIIVIEDGNLGLEKKSNGSIKLYDGKSVSVKKFSNGFVSIVEGSSSLDKYADGSVGIYDGVSSSIEKMKDQIFKICNSKSFIKKHPDGSVTAGDDNVLLINDVEGYVEVRYHDLSINKEEHGKQIMSDKRWSIVKDSSGNSSVKKGVETIVHDPEGIKVTIGLQPNENKNLMMQLKDHVLYVSSKNASFASFKVKLFNRIEDENVRICFSSNGTINVLVHRKKGTIACPQGTTRSESLKIFQSS